MTVRFTKGANSHETCRYLRQQQGTGVFVIKHARYQVG